MSQKAPQLKFSEDNSEDAVEDQASSPSAKEKDKDRLSVEREVDDGVKKKRKFVSFRSQDSLVQDTVSNRFVSGAKINPLITHWCKVALKFKLQLIFLCRIEISLKYIYIYIYIYICAQNQKMRIN